MLLGFLVESCSVLGLPSSEHREFHHEGRLVFSGRTIEAVGAPFCCTSSPREENHTPKQCEACLLTPGSLRAELQMVYVYLWFEPN